MKIATADYLYASSDNIGSMFAEMFDEKHNNPILSDFKLNFSKLSYTVSHGLSPYFHEEIVSNVKSSNLPFTLQVDEKTNAQVKKQFDMIVRYWSEDRIKVRYLNSLFLGHVTAEILNTVILQFLKQDSIPVSKLLQLGCDGPNVNKSLFDKLNASCRTAGNPG